MRGFSAQLGLTCCGVVVVPVSGLVLVLVLVRVRVLVRVLVMPDDCQYGDGRRSWQCRRSKWALLVLINRFTPDDRAGTGNTPLVGVVVTLADLISQWRHRVDICCSIALLRT